MKAKLYCLIAVFGSVLVVIGCCPMNPQLNTIKSAHGNTDWHIDTAEEFLTGKDMDGNSTATNHCPDTWTKTHMHEGMADTNEYYYDCSKNTAGKDSDVTNGIDKAMLFFYAGHGHPEHFDTLGNQAELTEMEVGNCDDCGKGTLRYYWQCSCLVFAHGPRICASDPDPFHRHSCPEDFDGSSDSVAMRNVYERWGAIIHDDLRMACGSSTLAYCHESETDKVWDNYNNQGFNVADSWIDGLHRYTWNTPLCITTGGIQTSSTALYDQTFTNQPNPSGNYLHIQYLDNFDTTAPDLFYDGLIPELIPIFEVRPMPEPDPYRKMKFEEKDGWKFSSNQVDGRGAAVKINLLSGAVYEFGPRKVSDITKALDEGQYIEYALKFLEERSWVEDDVLKPKGAKMVIERQSKNKINSERKIVQKNVIVKWRRFVKLGDLTVPMIGLGGLIKVQMNNDGSLLNASKVWRDISKPIRHTRTKSYEEAYKEALMELKHEGYKLENWHFGYKEAPGNAKQDELRAFFVFNFLPEDSAKDGSLPPRIVEVSAHAK